MLQSRALVSIATPARYMARLCNHFAHRVPVHREDASARIDFPGAPCTLQALEESLDIHLEAPDRPTLERLQEVVARHLKQVASTETFDVSWRDL
jgi:hypothetical protein